MTSASTASSGLPLVVHVAFVGKRNLLPAAGATGMSQAAFQDAVANKLRDRLQNLPAEIGLAPPQRYVVCALSSLAAGGDMLFTRACAALDWRQRILLPQAREDFLKACGGSGPDFSPEEADEARRLLASRHIIEERVASLSADRHTRFEDVNLELVRVCDVLVCLLPAEQSQDGQAGTMDALRLAQRWQRPVLELRLALQDDGTVELKDTWHGTPVPATNAASDRKTVRLALPAPLDRLDCPACGLTDADAYRKALKNFASDIARRQQNRFKWAALVIVGAHVAATALALLAFRSVGDAALSWLLGVELSFLSTGLTYHWWLHHSHAARQWAMARLSAEVARSVIPLAGVPRALSHLFELPMPPELRPLLRTLNVLHLAGLRSLAGNWTDRRQAYVDERLRKPRVGQLAYYADKLKDARAWRSCARATFYLGSIGALLATAAKLSLVLHWWHVSPAAHDLAAPVFGFLAVFLPVLAVAALSLSAAFDLEARVHTYQETHDFLREQNRLLDEAATENEFASLALQTEARLLGETASWYARRAFTGVA